VSAPAASGSGEASGESGIDLDGLLCALAIAPGTYSRNKNPRMYEIPAVRQVHRRARIVRGLARQLLRTPGTLEATGDGVVVRIEIASIGYRREARLTPLESDVLSYLLARARGVEAGAERARIEAAIGKLAGC
jgi:hypothetical protein